MTTYPMGRPTFQTFDDYAKHAENFLVRQFGPMDDQLQPTFGNGRLGGYGGPPPILNQPQAYPNLNNNMQPGFPVAEGNRKASIVSNIQEGSAVPMMGVNTVGSLAFPAQLRHLATAEQVIVKQKLELLERFETENKYEILNQESQVLYDVKESSDCCSRQCCGPLRPMIVHIFEPDGNPVLMLDRPLACQGIWCPCSQQAMSIMSPDGMPLGSVEEKWNIYLTLHDMDQNGEVKYLIKGPFCQCSWTCGDVEFPILTPDGSEQVGLISKKWRGFIHEYYTNADTFGVQFPPEAGIIAKAMLVAATFLVDYMYFEKPKNHSRRRHY